MRTWQRLIASLRLFRGHPPRLFRDLPGSGSKRGGRSRFADFAEIRLKKDGSRRHGFKEFRGNRQIAFTQDGFMAIPTFSPSRKQ